MARISGHVSTLALHRHVLAALGAEERARIDHHLETCDRCRALLDDEIGVQQRFTASTMPRHLEALPPGRRPWSWLLVPVLVPALAAALLLVLRPLERRDDRPDLLVKGDLHLDAYASRGGRVLPVTPGAALSPGDQIRFVVTGLPAGRPLHALVASVDGRGAVSVYFPFGGTASAPLEGPGPQVLPGSVVLDDAPGPERVFALFSPKPFTAEGARAALEGLGRAGPEQIRSARALAGVTQDQRTLWFEKSAR